MGKLLENLEPFLNPYFTNIWWVIFSVSLITLLLLWWAFHTIKQIHIQREYAAFSLQSIAKLWKKAKYVPEGAKDRESLYLYKDFLSRLDDSDSKYPIVVKNGGVRTMSRTEYDRMCNQKEKKSFSIWISILAVLYGVVVIMANYKNITLGIVIALIVPVMQMILAFFISRFKKEKNRFRTALFLELKEYSVDFFSITKPYIVVDSYPKKFGKNAEPKFIGLGEITNEQIESTKEYILRQKKAESHVVLEKTNNEEAETSSFDSEKNDTNKRSPKENFDTDEGEELLIDNKNTVDETQATELQNNIKKNIVKEDKVTSDYKEDKDVFLKLALSGFVKSEKERIAKETTSTTKVVEPDEDDFSLDSIGIALDAEIEKRRKIS